MEIVLALILGLGIYEYIKADEVDPNKHVVVDPQTRIVLEGQYTTNSYTRNLSDHKDVKWVFETL